MATPMKDATITTIVRGVHIPVELPKGALSLRITTPDGRIYVVSLDGNALKVRTLEEGLSIRPVATNTVLLYQTDHGGEPVTLVDGKGYIGDSPESRTADIQDLHAARHAAPSGSL